MFDAVHGGQQIARCSADYYEHGFQPIVVFDGAGRFVTAVRVATGRGSRSGPRRACCRARSAAISPRSRRNRGRPTAIFTACSASTSSPAPMVYFILRRGADLDVASDILALEAKATATSRRAPSCTRLHAPTGLLRRASGRAPAHRRPRRRLRRCNCTARSVVTNRNHLRRAPGSTRMSTADVVRLENDINSLETISGGPHTSCMKASANELALRSWTPANCRCRACTSRRRGSSTWARRATLQTCACGSSNAARVVDETMIQYFYLPKSVSARGTALSALEKSATLTAAAGADAERKPSRHSINLFRFYFLPCRWLRNYVVRPTLSHHPEDRRRKRHEAHAIRSDRQRRCAKLSPSAWILIIKFEVRRCSTVGAVIETKHHALLR